MVVVVVVVGGGKKWSAPETSGGWEVLQTGDLRSASGEHREGRRGMFP